MKAKKTDKKREQIFTRLEKIENAVYKYQERVMAETANSNDVIIVLTGLYEIRELNEKLRLL